MHGAEQLQLRLAPFKRRSALASHASAVVVASVLAGLEKTAERLGTLPAVELLRLRELEALEAFLTHLCVEAGLAGGPEPRCPKPTRQPDPCVGGGQGACRGR